MDALGQRKRGREEGDEGNRGPAPAVPAVPGNPAVGIAERGNFVQYLLRVFAKSDFKHDFGEEVPTRDLITTKDRVRFAELVQKLSVKERVDMLNKFDAEMSKHEKGTNLVELLKDTIASQLYPGDPGNVNEFKKEVEVLEMIGVNYGSLKEEVKGHFGIGLGLPTPPEKEPYKREQLLVTTPGVFSRNYSVTAQRYKNVDGTIRNLASLFKDVTGATKFALLVDASLGLSVTAVGNSSLTPDPGKPCTFTILQNVESDADSATGANKFLLTNGGANPTTVQILRDVTTSTVVYPIWTAPNPPSDTEHVFSKVQIIMNRIESGEIEASILLGDESHTIPDVGTTSNVKNASLNGLAAWFVREKDVGSMRKPYIYALLKRMGDWCQALSLLDRTRAYNQIDLTTKKKIAGDAKTLQDLMTENYQVGLVTNDRILLAYGLILGLNIYFTTASDLNCLLYFKNKDDIANEDQLGTIAEKNFTAFKDRIFKAIEVNVASIDALTQAAVEPYSNLVDLNTEAEAVVRPFFPVRPEDPRIDAIGKGLAQAFKTKVFLSNLGELRTNFGEIIANMKEAFEAYGVLDPKGKFSASVTLVNLADKYLTDLEHNKTVIGRLKAGRFSGPYTIQKAIFVDSLTPKMTNGGRMSMSEDMSRAKELLLSCRDDVKQILQKNIVLPDDLNGFIPPVPADGLGVRDIENFTALYGAFDAVRTPKQVAGGQQGGAPYESLVRSITQREVFPYKSKKLETTVKKLSDAGDERTLALLESLPAAQIETYYRDEKSRPYSVIDRYLITKEDSTSLTTLLAMEIADPTLKDFIVYRFALLYHDILYERIEHVFDQSNTGNPILVAARGTPPLLAESAEATEGSYEEVEVVARETAVLRVCINRYVGRDVTVIPFLLTSFQGGDVPDDVVNSIAVSALLAKRTPNASSLSKKIDEVRVNLEAARGVIFGKYSAKLIETVPEPGKRDVDLTGIEAVLESEGAVPAAVAMADGDDAPPAVAMADGDDARVGIPRANVGIPDDLQEGGESTSNALNTHTGSSRRRLYEGLRKRGGKGTDPKL
jgi:hypothetical protein